MCTERNFGRQITVLNFPQHAGRGLPFKWERVNVDPSSALTCIQVPSMVESLKGMLSNILNGSANNSSMPFISSWSLSFKVFLLNAFGWGKFESFSCVFVNFNISIERALLPMYCCTKASIFLYFSIFLFLSLYFFEVGWSTK